MRATVVVCVILAQVKEPCFVYAASASCRWKYEGFTEGLPRVGLVASYIFSRMVSKEILP
ncbi:hypothetical protein E2C01_058813 [Portunus trituberculatus]|uniref:Uncharacterized protein n=1 Tax=Portunus trituberculatus TaxID=210409 RepID=A0A5B7H3R4_PORTR|nr:hypothetical protein [Portunus trituberculatus]